MGLPQINIAFKELAETLSQRSSRGIIALILKDTANAGVTEIFENVDIPKTLKADNKKFLEIALIGNVNTPNKIITYVIGDTDTLDNALDFLETQEFNYLVMPSAVEADKAKIKDFVIKMRDIENVKIKAILGNTVADNRGIINFDTNDIVADNVTYSSDTFIPRIVGIVAGTPLTQSITYAKLPEVTSIPKMTRTDANTAIDAGKLILVRESGAIRIARGVNSLSTSDKKDDLLKKIKIVDILDLIHSDCKKVIIEHYIGKVPNSYDNKSLLITDVEKYLKEVSKEQLIQEDFSLGIDIEAQKSYLKSKGIDVNNMKEQDIKAANTGSNVFLKGALKVLDSVEDVSLNFSF